jgi:hypothetical protein
MTELRSAAGDESPLAGDIAVRISLEIHTQVDFDFKPENYPQGFTPQQALALELEQASQDPHEYLAMPRAMTHVDGRLIREDHQNFAPKQIFGGDRLRPLPARGH